MLLKHAWLKPLVAPAVAIIEEEEEDEENAQVPAAPPSPEEAKSSLLPPDVVDAEVAEWVIQASEKKRLGKLGKSEKPALHAAPLDAMVSPATEGDAVKAPDESTPLDNPVSEAKDVAAA